ncbi:MAG: universal stress protein [Chloroflexi bacterium]|nr:universal stress protein [Chloroflexota bacterium]
MFSTILVPLDGSDLARHALPYATTLAKATHARLVLLHAYVARESGAQPDPELDVIMELSDLASDLRAQGINASTWLVYEAAGTAIVQAVSDLRVDLVVMSTHGRGGLSRLLHGSVAEAVLRHVTIPVLLVSRLSEPRWHTDTPLTVIAPQDGSAFAAGALGLTQELARALGAEIVLLRALEPGDEASGPLSLPWRRGQPSLPDLIRAPLEADATRLREAGCQVRVQVDVGEPADAIVRLANALPAALVVMTTHGRGTLSRLMLESVTMDVLQHVQAPLLLVRPAMPASTDESETEQREQISV